MSLVVSVENAGVAQVYCADWAYHGEHGDANARVIAAAPEMLELLRDMTDYGERGRVPEPHWCEHARALLERIDGEGDK